MTLQFRNAPKDLFSVPEPRHTNGAAQDEETVASAVRDAHRAYSRALQATITEYNIGVGQWFFLKALQEEDGMTQRELSQRVGTMEPTTVSALNALESRDLVRRVRNKQDRRKVNIYLTERGAELCNMLQPRAEGLHDQALHGISAEDLTRAMSVLRRLSENLRNRSTEDDWDLLDGSF